MSQPILAHLNSGPFDDHQVVLPPGRYYYQVALPPRVDFAASLSAAPTASPPPRIGSYHARLDSMGQLVPHSMDGDAEFDWVG